MNAYVSNAAGMAALFDVWAAFEEHATELGELSLPVPVQITASGSATDGRAVLSAQLRGGNLAQLAAGLLAWADTLTGVTAWFWCSGEGSLHLYVYGRLTCDRLIQVWASPTCQRLWHTMSRGSRWRSTLRACVAGLRG